MTIREIDIDWQQKQVVYHYNQSPYTSRRTNLSFLALYDVHNLALSMGYRVTHTRDHFMRMSKQ